MKQVNAIKTHFLFLAVSAAALSGCYKAAERTAQLDKAVAPNLMSISDINELSSDTKASKKSLYVTSTQDSVTQLGSDYQQLKLTDKANMILKRIGKDDTQKTLDSQLKDGAVSFMVMNGKVKILRVVPDIDLTGKYGKDVLSLKYMNRMKELDRATDPAAQNAMQADLKAWRYQSPRKFNEKFGLVELADINAKTGIIENKPTDYGEKMSVLVFTEKPLSQSTHILLNCEDGTTLQKDGTCVVADAPADQ